MKKQIVIFLLALIVAIPAVAGGARCDGSKEEVTKMQTKLAQKAWLGLEYDNNDDGYYIINTVHDGSPADQAGFQKGDRRRTMQGEKYTKANKAALKKVWSKVAKPAVGIPYFIINCFAKSLLLSSIAPFLSGPTKGTLARSAL